MHFACCITKARNTHPEYVIFIAFPLQQLLRERASMLHFYVPCLSCLIMPTLSGTQLSIKQGLDPTSIFSGRQNFEHSLSCVEDSRNATHPDRKCSWTADAISAMWFSRGLSGLAVANTNIVHSRTEEILMALRDAEVRVPQRL